MAKTSSQFFEYRKNLYGASSVTTPLKVIIANSTTVKLGQAVRVNTAGFIVPASAGDALLGIVSGLVDNSNIPVNGFNYGGNSGHTKLNDDRLTTASDNTTRVTKVYAEVDVALPGVVFYNDADGALAQTNLMQFFDHDSDADQITVSTASDTSGQFQLIELDPDNDGDTSKGLFRISEPQLMSQIGNSTAVNEA